jgi:hypothetical protein
LGERLLCKQEVIGSIPFTSTTAQRAKRVVAGRVSDSEAIAGAARCRERRERLTRLVGTERASAVARATADARATRMTLRVIRSGIGRSRFAIERRLESILIFDRVKRE